MSENTVEELEYQQHLLEREKDEYGYCELTREEMNIAFRWLRKKYKETGKNGVLLSRVRDEIYGKEYMMKAVTGYDGGNYYGYGYWHCTQQVIDIVNELRKRGILIARDVIISPPDCGGGKRHPWKHVQIDPDTNLFYLE